MEGGDLGGDQRAGRETTFWNLKNSRPKLLTTLPSKSLEFAQWRWLLTWLRCVGHHEWQDERPVCMCPAHDDDTRIRDVTEATNVEQMMSPSAFSLIRPTIATYVAISSFYSGGWLASWRLVRVHFIIEAHDRQPSRIKT